MTKRFGIAVLALVFCATTSMAQEIEPVWFTTFNDDGSVLPILVKKGRSADDDGNFWQTGRRTSDSYMGLIRYDDSRLLLGVYTNGIDESNPNDNQELAAQYPDVSLIWINAANGHPIGVALEIGLHPVELTQAWIDGYGVDIPFFTDFDISDDGLIYVAFGGSILRYAPDGNDGFTGPEVVFEMSDQLIADTNPEDWGVSTFNVKGAGADTVITGGQNGTGYYLTTTDGNSFDIAFTYARSAWPPLGGAQSNPILNSEYEEEAIYTSGFGNNSGGNDSTFYRIVRPAGEFVTPFADDTELFSAQGMPESGDMDYKAHYIGDVGGADDLDWIVAYSTPSYNSDIEDTPGFLALHDVSGTADTDGGYISSIMIDVYHTQELRTAGGTTPDWFGTEGNLEVNIPEGAAENSAEILWCGGIYGYGFFKVGDIGEVSNVPNWSLF
ncbi:hypothetical protein K8I31_08050 [bacterium]|nr:hypothetical protein [bacterium]